jgi:hypothetical protein
VRKEVGCDEAINTQPSTINQTHGIYANSFRNHAHHNGCLLVSYTIYAPLTWGDLVSFGIGLFIFIIVLFLAIGFFFIGMGRYLLQFARTLGRRETKRRRIMQGRGAHLLTQTQLPQTSLTLPLSVRLHTLIRLKIFAVILTLIELGALLIIIILN